MKWKTVCALTITLMFIGQTAIACVDVSDGSQGSGQSTGTAGSGDANGPGDSGSAGPGGGSTGASGSGSGSSGTSSGSQGTTDTGDRNGPEDRPCDWMIFGDNCPEKSGD